MIARGAHERGGPLWDHLGWLSVLVAACVLAATMIVWPREEDPPPAPRVMTPTQAQKALDALTSEQERIQATKEQIRSARQTLRETHEVLQQGRELLGKD